MTDIITIEERLKIFEILYPNMDYDMNFYSNINVESILDEIGIPKRRDMPFYVFGTDEDLKNEVNINIKNHLNKRYKK